MTTAVKTLTTQVKVEIRVKDYDDGDSTEAGAEGQFKDVAANGYLKKNALNLNRSKEYQRKIRQPREL